MSQNFMLECMFIFIPYSRFFVVFSCFEQLQLHATNSCKFSFHFYSVTNIFKFPLVQLHRYTHHFKINISQSNLEKEEWNRRNQLVWLQARLQSHSHQDSMVLARSQKYRSMEQNRKPRDKSTYLRTPYLWQRRQEIYNGKKTISLTHGT